MTIVATDGEPPSDLYLADGWRVLQRDGRFNYSAVCNFGALNTDGEYVLFLNDDTEVETPDWIEQLIVQVQQPGVGIAGAKLVYPNNTLQLGGVLLADDEHGARCMGLGLDADDPGYMGLFRVVRNTSSVSGAAMLLTREMFDSMSGFDENLAVELGDVDLCLRVIESGRRVVWTPRAVLTHHERGSRGERSTSPRSLALPPAVERSAESGRSLLQPEPQYSTYARVRDRR